MKDNLVQEDRVLKTFSEKIRLRRLEKRISQTKLAVMLGIHVNTLLNIEKANSSPNLMMALKISKALDISIDELLTLVANGLKI